MVRPGRIAASIVSGTGKSSLIVEMSLIVAISVPWLDHRARPRWCEARHSRRRARVITRSPIEARASAPGRARRRPRRPGRRDRRWVAKPRCFSVWIRCELLLRLALRAPGPRRAGRSPAPWASTATTWPRRTKAPSSKPRRTIRSVTGADRVTCSLATRGADRLDRSTKRIGRRRLGLDQRRRPARAPCPRRRRRPRAPRRAARRKRQTSQHAQRSMPKFRPLSRAAHRLSNCRGRCAVPRREQKLDIAFRAGDRAFDRPRRPSSPATSSHRRRRRADALRGPRDRGPRRPCRSRSRSASNCGLTSAISRPPGLAKPSAVSSTLASEMKLASQTMMSTGSVTIVVGQIARVGLLMDDDARILPELPGELVGADVDREHLRRAPAAAARR